MAYKRKRSYSKRPTKRRKTVRRPRRSNYKCSMRKTFMSMVETKKEEYSYSKFESYHNADPVFCFLNGNVQNPDDGEESTQRIGDEIQQLGFKAKMMLYKKIDRPNVTWKVKVVSTPRAFVVSSDQNSGTFPKAEFYRQTSGNCLLDDVENGTYTTHKSLTFKNPQIQANLNGSEANESECITTRQM